MAEAPKGLAKDIDEGMDKLKGNILETWQTSLNNMAKLTLKTGEDAAAGASGEASCPRRRFGAVVLAPVIRHATPQVLIAVWTVPRI